LGKIHVKLLGTVHTRGESLQDGLGDIQTHKMTLALAYILYHLSAMWLWFQNRKKSKIEVSTDFGVLPLNTRNWVQ